MGNGLKNLLTVLWIGGMWIIGVLVAPILMGALEHGQAVGVWHKIMHAFGWVGIVAGIYLLVYRIWLDGLRAFQTGAFWLIVGMLVCTLINQFAVFPLVVGVKTAMSQSAEGLFGGGLSNWETISSAIYLLQALFGLLYVWGMDNR